MKADAAKKTAYFVKLRSLNPDCIFVDVDEFIEGGGSVRDSGADSYTARPLRLESIIAIIKDMTAKTAQHRSDLRRDAEEQLRPPGQDRG